MADIENSDGIFKLTMPIPMSFPVLFEPQAYKENGKAVGEPKYSARFLFPAGSDELKAFKTLAAKLARASWPDKPFFVTTTEGQKLPQVIFPWADGTESADKSKAKNKNAEYLRNTVIVTAKSKYPPTLSYVENKKIIECVDDTAKLAAKGKFYSGVEVLAEFNLVAYEGKGGKLPGVTAYLNKVLSTGKGTRLAGGTSSAEAFKGYLGAVSAEDPTAPGVGEDLDGLI